MEGMGKIKNDMIREEFKGKMILPKQLIIISKYLMINLKNLQ